MMAIPKTAVRLLLGWAIFYVLIIGYGYMRFYRDPGSIFYRHESAFVRQYTDFRLGEVATQIKDFTLVSFDNRTVVKAGAKPKICVHFATVKRDGDRQYIDDAIASALVRLTPEERQDIYISTFFANTDPTVHPSFNESWIRTAVDEVYSMSPDDQAFSRLQHFEQIDDFKAKGVADYIHGLQHCYDKGIPYALMLEGDIIFADAWLVKTLEALDYIEHKHVWKKEKHDWIYLRLFNQERSIGWASNKIGANKELWIVLGIDAAVVLFAMASKSIRRRLDNWSLALICLLVIPSFVIFFFQAGKANILPPRPGVLEQNFGCCSQALLYPRQQIPGLVQFLERLKRGQVDLMINVHAREAELTRFSLYPVQVQHVGLTSARKTDLDEARSIWSMAFEDKNPVSLAREHQRLVQSIYHPPNGPQQRADTPGHVP